MGDLTEPPSEPAYRATMERLEALKRTAASGANYWIARDIHTVLGYPTWREFDAVIQRAMKACETNQLDVTKHFVPTHKMLELGGGAKRRGDDFFLSRAASYLIAMNGDPSKPEIAAAQAYFAVQTRRMEIEDSRSADQKRLDLREKVSASFKKVSGIAKTAGVRSRMQPVFHDARYRGLYGMSGRNVKRRKGLRDDANIFDFAGPLELSANDFQMRLAADVLEREKTRGEQAEITVNQRVGSHVRNAMIESKATMPEDLPLEAPIIEVKKRLKAATVKKLSK
jgi:DNA-damage-inducible protein D